MWGDVMVEIYESMIKKNVWEVVPRRVDKSTLGSRLIFNVKEEADGSIEKYKAKFVSKGYSQVEGIENVGDLCSSARYSVIRSIISLAVRMG